jgi:DNA processing protein
MPRLPPEVPDPTLRLALCGGLGPAFHHAALRRFGSAEAVLAAGARDLAEATAVPEARAAAILRELGSVDVASERAAMERIGAGAVVLGDADYPRLLASVPLAPLLLWVRGAPAAWKEDTVAVVGARRATPYGEGQAARFAAALAGAGIAVVSGGARGIDAAAHRAALRSGGSTVAVVGCGLGQAYPPEHGPLFESIVEAGGALVSEFPVDWPCLQANFPRRNRIISGMSLTVLVVEAGEGSGALITARHAIDDHQREPCAVPGPVDSPRSAGCNAAIRDGWVRCVLDPAELIDAARASTERSSPGTPSPGRAVDPPSAGPRDADDDVGRAAAILRRRPSAGTEEIARRLGIPVERAAALRTLAAVRMARDPASREGGQFQPSA